MWWHHRSYYGWSYVSHLILFKFSENVKFLKCICILLKLINRSCNLFFPIAFPICGDWPSSCDASNDFSAFHTSGGHHPVTQHHNLGDRGLKEWNCLRITALKFGTLIARFLCNRYRVHGSREEGFRHASSNEYKCRHNCGTNHGTHSDTYSSPSGQPHAPWI